MEDPRRRAQTDRRIAGGDYAGHDLTGEELDSLEKRAGGGEIAGVRTTRWIRCRKPSTGCAPWGAYPSSPRQWRGRRPATAVGWRDRRESDPRRGRRRRRWATEPQQIPSAGTWT